MDLVSYKLVVGLTGCHNMVPLRFVRIMLQRKYMKADVTKIMLLGFLKFTLLFWFGNESVGKNVVLHALTDL